jgi:hypothetical protein
MCDSCGQVDDHPRHVHGTGEGGANTTPAILSLAFDAAGSDEEARQNLLRHAQDTTTQMKHLDCCAADGCPDGTCQLTVQGAEGKTGTAMLKHVQSKATADRVGAYLKQREKEYASQNEATQTARAAELARADR